MKTLISKPSTMRRQALALPSRLAFASVALLACFGLFTGRAQAPALITDHSAYFPGEDIVVAFQNGPGNRRDWIGIYPEGVQPGTVGSTRWYYVDGTQTGATGFREGSVTFAGGLNLAGNWFAYLLLNDGYTILAQTTFTVVDPGTTLVRTDQRVYATGETITATFANGPANPKDWLGIYPEGIVPGSVPSTLWSYTDGAGGTTGMTDGAVQFANGLKDAGNYVVYLLLNDGYDVLASETFTVYDASAARPRLLTQQPANNASNLPPVVEFVFTVTNGASKVVADTVKLAVDGATVAHALTQQADLVTIAYTNTTFFPLGSAHTFVLTFADNASPPNSFTNQGAFTVGVWRNVVLPAPLFFENFDNTPEGQLPTGWTEQNYTDIQNPEFDLGNLDSASYATWTVVNAERFTGSFVTYSNPDTPPNEAEDYHRVLSINRLNVVDGKIYDQPLAKGRFVFGDSGYRNGRSQVLYLFTPDFNLTGQKDIYLSFHSLWEQNQDSIGAVEYSVDGGTTWLPIVYMLEVPDVLLDAKGNVDAVATLTTPYTNDPLNNVAVYTDPDTGLDVGGCYGAFIGAVISQDLAPYISPRVNDDPVESKRIELFRLPAADNQAKVRFRFAHAGTDSWYFGIDDFGLYSIPTVEPPTIDVQPADLTVTAGDAATLSVQVSGTPPFQYQWFRGDQPVTDGTNASLKFLSVKLADWGRYFVRVANTAGSVDSLGATLTVKPRPPAVSGAWDFDRGDLSITAGVGSLEYADGAATAALTSFGTTDDVTVPYINGLPARFMRVPAFTQAANGYALTMPTAPNGGGGYVNRYTMVFDLLIPGSVNWTPLFNTNPGNANDADFYVSDTGALGIAALGYSADGAIAPDTWYRIAFVADLGAGLVTYYVNGDAVHSRTGASLLNGRFSLYSGQDAGPDVRLFNEPSGSYTHELLLNSFMFTDRAMSAEELKALGGPSATGIPADITITEPLKLTISMQAATVVLSWSGGAGPYQLQRTASLANPSWENAGPPTTANTFSETVGSVAAFYRVLGQ